MSTRLSSFKIMEQHKGFSISHTLVSLMDDQVKYLQSLGLSAINISSESEVDHSKIEKASISLYMAPLVMHVEQWGVLA